MLLFPERVFRPSLRRYGRHGNALFGSTRPFLITTAFLPRWNILKALGAEDEEDRDVRDAERACLRAICNEQLWFNVIIYYFYYHLGFRTNEKKGRSLISEEVSAVSIRPL